MPQPPLVGRGGLKLAAALERFGLGARVPGAQALDVGASTGGFTDVLLRAGAAHVTAVDVGHGQLDPGLRADPRVTSLERADWKTLSLDLAPGPFDFFAVDVSFVAARNMLRGLAFRLRAGAEGVVLVKPQFELPPREVAAHGVADPELRRRAMDRFRDKGTALGFRVLDVIDSPVAGGSGTIELLAHVRFEGRTEKLPARGAKKVPVTTPSAPNRTVAGPAHVARTERWFAVAAPGMEEVVRREVAALAGVADARAVEGGVEFAGAIDVGMRANLWLRCATRVVARLGSVEARDFARLRRGLAKLDWARFVRAGGNIDVKASASRCRLFHTGALCENVEHAIADRLGRSPRSGGDAPSLRAGDAPAPQRILLRGVDDVFTVSIDASGDLLHKRGARQETGKAPMRETLAAAILLLAGWDPTTPLVDPLCGAGTLPIEACAIARRLAPGIGRRFAFESWPGFDAALWERLRAEARAIALPAAPAPIVGSDRDARSIESARRNAERAGFADLRFEVRELGEARPPAGAGVGLVVANPPYGRRIGRGHELRRLHVDLGRVLRAHFGGWRAAVLAADDKLAAAIGLRSTSAHPLSNGGIRVKLFVYEVPGP